MSNIISLIQSKFPKIEEMPFLSAIQKGKFGRKRIVMDRGKIVENGTHRELLSLGGLYAKYWARQSGGFIETYQAAE